MLYPWKSNIKTGHHPKSQKGCLHKLCKYCNGTGVKKNGQNCLYMISCPCEKCNPYFM